MALIPIEMLDQMKKANLTPLTQPNKDRVVKEMATRAYRIVSKLADIVKNLKTIPRLPTS